MAHAHTQPSRLNRYAHLMHDLAVQRDQFLVDFEPSHAKMGILVKEASERAAEILTRKS